MNLNHKFIFCCSFLFTICHAFATNYINYCIISWHAANAVLLNQIRKQCYKIIWSIFYRDKFSEVSDVYRNYGILEVNDLFKFHVACLCTNKSVIISCLFASKMFFLKLAMLDLVKLDNPNNLYLPLYKTSVCRQTISFFEVKFGTINP